MRHSDFALSFALAESGYGDPREVKRFLAWLKPFKRPLSTLDVSKPPAEEPSEYHSYDGTDWFYRWDIYQKSGVVIGRPEVYSKTDFDLPRDKNSGYVIPFDEFKKAPVVDLNKAKNDYIYTNYPNAKF